MLRNTTQLRVCGLHPKSTGKPSKVLHRSQGTAQLGLLSRKLTLASNGEEIWRRRRSELRRREETCLDKKR